MAKYMQEIEHARAIHLQNITYNLNGSYKCILVILIAHDIHTGFLNYISASLLRNFPEIPLRFCLSLFSMSIGFDLHDNLTPQLIVLKFMSVINHGHGKILITFQHDAELFNGG